MDCGEQLMYYMIYLREEQFNKVTISCSTSRSLDVMRNNKHIVRPTRGQNPHVGGFNEKDVKEFFGL